MKKLLSSLLCFILCMAVFSAVVAGGFANDSEAIEKATKSVLMLFVYDNEMAEATDYFATGSGFVAFNSSTLITNYHVIDGGKMILALDDDNNAYELDKVLCADKNYDIAILEFSEPTKLKPFDLYADDHINRGSDVVAIGSPYGGNKNTVTKGIVSSQSDRSDGRPEIQFTAQISHGNSGGVLLNDDGKVIGIPTESFEEGQNLNFAVNVAVPIAMYKAWDGQKYSLKNHKESAKMDFTGVYSHTVSENGNSTNNGNNGNEGTADTGESWICLNCGHENISKFCLECGAEKPYWVCSCGRVNSSNKFCGDCGQKLDEMISSFNGAVLTAGKKDYAGAIEIMEKLGAFDSGSFETAAGAHGVAKDYVSKLYYEQGVYLQENDGAHDEIVAAFTNAGDYGDAKEQVQAENARYKKYWYDTGVEQLNNGKYDEAVESFTKADDYPKAQQMIQKTYYSEAEEKLNNKEYDAAITLFEKLGEYSDAAEKVLEIYYLQGKDALDQGDSEKATEYFKNAGDYKDSKTLIADIKQSGKEKTYADAVKALEDGDYQTAIELFAKVLNYKDATKLRSRAIVFKRMQSVNMDSLESLPENELSKLRDYVKTYNLYEDKEVTAIYQRICYALGMKRLQLEKYEMAVINIIDSGELAYQQDKLEEVKEKCWDKLVLKGKIELAMRLYVNVLKPGNYPGDLYLVMPGSTGEGVKNILNLLKPAGVKCSVAAGEDEYKEEYKPYVEELEKHFGMTADGMITISEYNEISGALYQGYESDEVAGILEKLADLTYIQKLPAKHNIYEARYVKAVKKAEKQLGLLEDGIITHSEQETILRQTVDNPGMPENLKATVKNENVTLTWSKVPGAVGYIVKQGSDILGTTEKTNWTDKNVETGTTLSYTVSAKKYTTNSQAAMISVNVPIYYIKVTIPELVKNQKKYIGRHVEVKGLTFDDWRIKGPDGRTYQSKNIMPNPSDGSELHILCKASEGLVELVMPDINNWDFGDGSIIDSCFSNKIRTVSGKGVVREETSSWIAEKQDGSLILALYFVYGKSVPSIELESVNWRSVY